MPDLTLHTAKWCSQNTDFETFQGRHRVTYHSGKWWCSCEDHRFRKRECKHIIQAQRERCTRGFEAIAGSPDHSLDGLQNCPDCGSILRIVQYAV